MSTAELQRSIIRQTAADLPLDEARALWLVDVCGLTYAHAAREATTTPGTIAMLVSSGRTRLRSRLDFALTE